MKILSPSGIPSEEVVLSNQPEHINVAPGYKKLLLTPEEYAKSAITSLKEQLLTVRSSKRLIKLQGRLAEWEKTLQILEEDDVKQEKNTKEESVES